MRCSTSAWGAYEMFEEMGFKVDHSRSIYNKFPLKVLERLLTKVYRTNRRPVESIVCALCREEPEKVAHHFCRCVVAQELWSKVRVPTPLGELWDIEGLWEAGKSL
ncbi:hypothetical protein QJS10_CPA01g01994 [Acorus calamus]|uniref:Reverse transcriptase zinc-binding domain-containing protein n=1 Tax=Acorus calamus TaxID=4465 RepID=A0AAV9FFN1_ACOCL|nr:hypothetical protein QJS10_CPA01g01994 [Acorus calamus]